MGRELQKKKNRSSIPKIKLKPRSKKRMNPKGNAIVAANWDRSQTLTQNYHRLGLTSRLNAVTGGSAIKKTKSSTASKLSISNVTPTVLAPVEARVERDENGKIIRVIHSDEIRKSENLLNDPLNDLSGDDISEDDSWDGLDEDETTQNSNNVIAELEDMAAREKKKEPRKQSTREKEWIERLVAKHGDNTAAMSRDMRLNPMQQTEADISRRVRKWKEQTA